MGDPKWLTGDELSTIVENDAIQFSWAVLSGFSPNEDIDLSRLEVYPSADGNAALWAPGVEIQHPRARVEIVCWDSGATLVLTRDDDVGKGFRRFFPEAVDLDAYNAGNAAR